MVNCSYFPWQEFLIEGRACTFEPRVFWVMNDVAFPQQCFPMTNWSFVWVCVHPHAQNSWRHNLQLGVTQIESDVEPSNGKSWLTAAEVDPIGHLQGQLSWDRAQLPWYRTQSSDTHSPTFDNGLSTCRSTFLAPHLVPFQCFCAATQHWTAAEHKFSEMACHFGTLLWCDSNCNFCMKLKALQKCQHRFQLDVSTFAVPAAEADAAIVVAAFQRNHVPINIKFSLSFETIASSCLPIREAHKLQVERARWAL